MSLVYWDFEIFKKPISHPILASNNTEAKFTKDVLLLFELSGFNIF